jgi:hypothetical protein
MFLSKKRNKMKTLLAIILLFSAQLYSQENLKNDVIISKMGNSHNCFITYLDDEYVMIKSDDETSLKFFLDTIDKIEINNLGVVYSNSSKFNLPLDSIKVYLIARNEKHASYTAADGTTENQLINPYEATQLFNNNKIWYFAVYYYPSINKELAYTYIYPTYRSTINFAHYQQIVYEIEQNLISMESQLGFNIHQNLFLTLSLGYSSDLYKTSSTATTTYPNSNNFVTINEYQNSIDKFSFEFGIKHYFGMFKVEGVNPFIIFSIGKQLAFIDNYERSYTVGQTNNYYQTNNESEFLEDIYSPILVSIGFGAEYAISESLSLSGFFNVKYSSASSQYEWKTFYEGIINETGTENVEVKDVKYKTGLGLSFFF